MEHNNQLNSIHNIYNIQYQNKNNKPSNFDDNLDDNISTYKNTFDTLTHFLKNTTNQLTIIKSEINYNQHLSNNLPPTFNIQFNILFNNNNNEHTVYNFELLALHNMFSVKTFSAIQSLQSNPFYIKQTTNNILPQIVNKIGLQHIIINIINYINKINKIHNVDIHTDTTIKTQLPRFYLH